MGCTRAPLTCRSTDQPINRSTHASPLSAAPSSSDYLHVSQLAASGRQDAPAAYNHASVGNLRALIATNVLFNDPPSSSPCPEYLPVRRFRSARSPPPLAAPPRNHP